MKSANGTKVQYYDSYPQVAQLASDFKYPNYYSRKGNLS